MLIDCIHPVLDIHSSTHTYNMLLCMYNVCVFFVYEFMHVMYLHVYNVCIYVYAEELRVI